MISGFIVKKSGMSNRFDEKGRLQAVTVCQADPLLITQIKNPDKDGYSAVQVAYGRRYRQSAAVKSKLAKLKIKEIPRGFIEFPLLDSHNPPQPGNSLTIDTALTVGDIINVTGVTKGRGFAGVIKRHGFHRQPVTRGQSDRTRHGGAIGAQTPGKVIKGKKMPGHYGAATQTVSNLKILAVDAENGRLLISGATPGHKNSWLIIHKVLR